MEDDETMVNSNLKGNKAQLQAMFETADFPELEPVESAPGHRKAPTQEESANELTGEQDKHASDKRMNQGEITIKSTHRATKGGLSSSRCSYKVAVTQRDETTSDASKSTQSSDRRREFMELKSLIEATNQMMQEHNTVMMISRNEAKASTRQVQRLTKYN